MLTKYTHHTIRGLYLLESIRVESIAMHCTLCVSFLQFPSEWCMQWCWVVEISRHFSFYSFPFSLIPTQHDVWVRLLWRQRLDSIAHSQLWCGEHGKHSGLIPLVLFSEHSATLEHEWMKTNFPVLCENRCCPGYFHSCMLLFPSSHSWLRHHTTTSML